MTTVGTVPAVRSDADGRTLGPVMGLVAVTIGFTALGAWLGRDLSGGAGLALFIGVFALVFALSGAAARGREQLATGLLFALGLVLGLAIAPVLSDYASADPAALWQAAGLTATFVAGLGAYGYSTRRDLSSWARPLVWALLALLGFGIVAIFVSIPGGNLIWSIGGLVIFGGFTVYDFNRLRRGTDNAVLIASSIFLDVLNIFVFVLDLLGAGKRG
ncbi:Bax inhibitor-1/YccA family protein [Solirubrobacter taibaiensis]|nr:Bax inhibitor-1/YccA family protein [Solirubrobacter taibaiensis]